jgi:hypothetical protein
MGCGTKKGMDASLPDRPSGPDAFDLKVPGTAGGTGCAPARVVLVITKNK